MVLVVKLVKWCTGPSGVVSGGEYLRSSEKVLLVVVLILLLCCQ